MSAFALPIVMTVVGINILNLILTIYGMWKTFDKIGIAGWKSVVPVYNFYLLFKKL